MVDAERLLEIEKKSPTNLQNEKIVIINFNNNKIVYTTDNNRELNIGGGLIEKVKAGQLVTYKQSPFEVLGALFYNDYGRFIVIAAATDTERSRRQKTLIPIMIVVCFVSLLFLFAGGWIYSGRALKPISDVVNRVQEISITSLNLRVNEGNGTDELGRLAKTFNNMLARLETSFAMQKEFISNASHELRTPLTSINGQIEVLMMKERSSEEYRSALESVLEDIKKLIDLSNKLLLIARTSSENPVRQFRNTRIDEIIWLAQEEIIRFNKSYHINIHMDELLTDSDKMVVEGDENLLKVAVSNIIENGCKYSSDHTVDIKFGHPGKFIDIKFEDRGIGISEEDLKKVFEPFYRGSNTISYKGSGIGLQLANQIILNHNGTIKISSELNKGTTVTVVLPSLS